MNKRRRKKAQAKRAWKTVSHRVTWGQAVQTLSRALWPETPGVPKAPMVLITAIHPGRDGYGPDVTIERPVEE